MKSSRNCTQCLLRSSLKRWHCTKFFLQICDEQSSAIAPTLAFNGGFGQYFSKFGEYSNETPNRSVSIYSIDLRNNRCKCVNSIYSTPIQPSSYEEIEKSESNRINEYKLPLILDRSNYSFWFPPKKKLFHVKNACSTSVIDPNESIFMCSM